MQDYPIGARMHVVPVIRVSSPDKIMHIPCYKMPGQLILVWRRNIAVSISDFRCIDQLSRSSNHISGIKGQLHIIITPDSVELPCQIRIGVPTPGVVFTEFGIPLGHRVTYPFIIVPSAAPDLQGDLGFVGHKEFCRLARSDWLGKSYFKYSPGNLKLQGLSILSQAEDTLISYFIWLELTYICPDPGISIRQRTRLNIHRTSGLKSIEIEMKIDFIKGLGGIVLILYSLLPGEPICMDIKPHLHLITDRLLPVISGCLSLSMRQIAAQKAVYETKP